MHTVCLQRNTVNSFAICFIEQKIFFSKSTDKHRQKMANRNNSYQVNRPKSQPVNVVRHLPVKRNTLPGTLSGKSRITGNNAHR